MKPRTQIYLTLGVLVGLFALWGATHAAAQRLYGPTPFAVPSLRMPAPGGLFYFQSGIRYRNIQDIRFDSVAHTVESRINGFPAFGPNQSGDFGTGTGVRGFPRGVGGPGLPCTLVAVDLPTLSPVNDPDCSGVWFYDNGKITARQAYSDFGVPPAHSGIQDPGPPVINYPDDQLYDPDVMPGQVLGHREGPSYFDPPSPAPENLDGINVGWWSVSDTAAQFNSATASETTRVSFRKVIDGTYDATYGVTDGSGEVESRIWQSAGAVFADDQFAEKIWTPTFEIGMQYTDYFDIFYAFSFFDFSPTLSKSFVYPAEFMRRAYTDVYPFFSSADSGWPGSINSVSNISGLDANDYYLWPDGQGRGAYPNRTFEDVPSCIPCVVGVDPNCEDGCTTGSLREDISHRADIHTYENRFGVRSWYPLYGLGRVGFSMGAVISYIYYRLASSQVISAATDLGGGVVAGDLLSSQAHSLWDYWANYGGFVGMDLSLNYNGYFLRGAADWAFCEDEDRQILSIITRYNPGGFSLGINGGLFF